MAGELRIQRTGGLHGRAANGVRPLAELTGAQRRALDRLLAASAPQPPTVPSGGDRYVYSLTVTDDAGREQRLTVGDEAMPDELLGLLSTEWGL
ncbi:MAG: protealysin inhibitor emfourin [Acidimicrobiales bacterium]